MTWAEGDEWAVELELEPGPHAFKLVVVGPDGSATEWEPGSNREVVVSSCVLICSHRSTSLAALHAKQLDLSEQHPGWYPALPLPGQERRCGHRAAGVCEDDWLAELNWQVQGGSSDSISAACFWSETEATVVSMEGVRP